jgi:hypothetical protein
MLSHKTAEKGNVMYPVCSYWCGLGLWRMGWDYASWPSTTLEPARARVYACVQCPIYVSNGLARLLLKRAVYARIESPN